MPIVTITLQAGRPDDELQAIMDAIHQGLVSELNLPNNSRNQRLHEIRPALYQHPTGKSDRYMSVEIAAFPGRAATAKHALFQAICQNLKQAVDLDPADIIILIHEPPLQNWGINGQSAG